MLLSGEAGIGKSRLAAEFLQRLAGEPHQRLRYFCSPQHTDSALYPIIAQLERAAGHRTSSGTRIPPSQVVSRPRWIPGTQKSPMHAYAWYVWRKEPRSGPALKVRVGRHETIAALSAVNLPMRG